MRIILKNKETLLYDDFKFKCSIGKNQKEFFYYEIFIIELIELKNLNLI